MRVNLTASVAIALLLAAACAAPAVGPSTTPTASAEPSTSASESAAPSSAASSSPVPATALPATTPPATMASPDAEAEAMLMAGIRADVRSAGCAPLRDGLPPGASAGIRCDIGSGPVDWVAFHAFTSADELLAAYTQAMASAGIPLRTELPDPGQSWEDCWRGFPWEAFYWPRGDVAGGMNREGCFRDEDGKANLRYLWEVPGVSIEVVGASGDIAELKSWSWYDATGGEPEMGGPGLWQPDSLPAGEPSY